MYFIKRDRGLVHVTCRPNYIVQRQYRLQNTYRSSDKVQFARHADACWCEGRRIYLMHARSLYLIAVQGVSRCTLSYSTSNEYSAQAFTL